MTENAVETGKVIVILDGKEYKFEHGLLNVTMDSSEADILNAVESIFREDSEGNTSLKSDGDWVYTINKALNQGNIYVYPKSTAGFAIFDKHTKLESPRSHEEIINLMTRCNEAISGGASDFEQGVLATLAWILDREVPNPLEELIPEEMV